MTRAEFVAIVNRIIGIEGASSSAPVFDDLKSGHWTYGDIMVVYIK